MKVTAPRANASVITQLQLRACSSEDTRMRLIINYVPEIENGK